MATILYEANKRRTTNDKTKKYEIFNFTSVPLLADNRKYEIIPKYSKNEYFSNSWTSKAETNILPELLIKKNRHQAIKMEQG